MTLVSAREFAARCLLSLTQALGAPARHPIPNLYHTIKTISHWIPAAFCAFISLMALFVSGNSIDSGWWRPAFFSFLPMYFFFVGSATTQMHRELCELRRRIAELEQRSSS